MQTGKQAKVAVAMSGGVDSSVAAALLKQAGYGVFGIYAKTWTSVPGDGTDCTWVADRRDALRVAAALEIPLVTLDLENDYRQSVVQPLFDGYAQGRTPNPDVLCNRIIKFGALWQHAQALGATHLATGHYARIEHAKTRHASFVTGHQSQLLRGVDPAKDQSYFLWDIPAEVVPQVLLPIGDYHKEEVRRLAVKFDVPTAQKKDSQGICFLGQTDLKTFLGTRLDKSRGLIRDIATNKIVGQHDGAQFVTIGQRHGIGQLIGAPSLPLHVVKIDITTNTIWVGRKERLYHSSFIASEVNWLDRQFAATLREGTTQNVLIQVRYHQPPQEATISIQHGKIDVKTERPIFAPAPGQSVVFYRNDQVLGGAHIQTITDAITREEQLSVGGISA